MLSIKEQIIKVVQEQPDDSSYDEILKELAFRRMVELGLADSDAQRTISNEEIRRRILMGELAYAQAGRSFNREEMNER